MDANDEAIRVLTAVPYLEDVNAALVATIARETIRQEYNAGQVVFMEGEQDVALLRHHVSFP